MSKLKNQYIPTVAQIQFGYYGQPGSSPEYFGLIDKIANEIGNDLETNSTIVLNQCKEKFGQVRVYCTLSGKEDARTYRDVYLKAFEKYPEYFNAIRGAADYPALLCMTKEELDELLDSEYYKHAGFEYKNRKELYEVCGFK